MNDSQLLRYSRHILLDELGIEAQETLLGSRALIVGAGGLGSPVALYLGSAGVGHITVVDDDTVDLTNLQRQIAHKMSSVGMFKTESIVRAVAEINPDVQLVAVTSRADDGLLDALVQDADVVLDCTDNFATRHAINRACVRHRKPLVSGAAIRFDGQLSVYDSAREASPCYACVFPETAHFEETSCAAMGVFAPLVGIMGSMQAAEALKILTHAGESLAGRLLMLDARAMVWNEIAIPRNPECGVCSSAATPLVID